jgi:hypothetical protein
MRHFSAKQRISRRLNPAYRYFAAPHSRNVSFEQSLKKLQISTWPAAIIRLRAFFDLKTASTFHACIFRSV